MWLMEKNSWNNTEKQIIAFTKEKLKVSGCNQFIWAI